MSSLYDNARNMFAKAELAWKASGGATIKAFLVDGALYTPNLATDIYLSSIPVGARKGNLGAGTLTDAPQLTILDPVAGICDAEDITFTTIPPGISLEYLVLCQDTGNETTSPLVALIDSGVGLPVISNGADIDIIWSNSTNKIFKL